MIHFTPFRGRDTADNTKEEAQELHNIEFETDMLVCTKCAPPATLKSVNPLSPVVKRKQVLCCAKGPQNQ